MNTECTLERDIEEIKPELKEVLENMRADLISDELLWI